MHTALTIAGSDSSGGAGIQGDLKTFAAHGVYGVCAVTAVTAQNTMGVSASGAGAAHNGAPPEAPVAAAIDELELPNLVVDPVIAASGGTRLLDADGVQAMMALLFPRARVVTPNIPEAEALGGRTIGSMADLREAARRIHAMGPTAVIITGGHARDRAPRADIVDLLFDGRTFAELRVQRVAGGNLHGTGCAFASSVAAHLARGASLHDAAARAQQYVARALAARLSVARGGALDHFAPTGPP
jgi:hydroxymethylpyrimidine/phosphomethylpyrimidine kinase